MHYTPPAEHVRALATSMIVNSMDAIAAYATRRQCVGRSPESRRNAMKSVTANAIEAWLWFLGSDAASGTRWSFVEMCELLNLDADIVYAGIIRSVGDAAWQVERVTLKYLDYRKKRIKAAKLKANTTREHRRAAKEIVARAAKVKW